MDLKDYCFDGEGALHLDELPHSAREAGVDKEQRPAYEARTAENLARIAALQEKLYAEGARGLIVLLQAMDAAGKDSVIKHVMGAVNPQGVDVVSFKQPSKEELSHDYLWRAACALPARGKIAIFNRSYYEDVLVVRVHRLHKGYQMPARCLDEDDKDFFERRHKQIRGFEEYLYDNGYRIVKLFLNVSREKQKERFLERIDDEAKNWKFSSSDLKERAFWDEYQRVYADVLRDTASRHAPWYVIPGRPEMVHALAGQRGSAARAGGDRPALPRAARGGSGHAVRLQAPAAGRGRRRSVTKPSCGTCIAPRAGV